MLCEQADLDSGTLWFHSFTVRLMASHWPSRGLIVWLPVAAFITFHVYIKHLIVNQLHFYKMRRLSASTCNYTSKACLNSSTSIMCSHYFQSICISNACKYSSGHSIHRFIQFTHITSSLVDLAEFTSQKVLIHQNFDS